MNRFDLSYKLSNIKLNYIFDLLKLFKGIYYGCVREDTITSIPEKIKKEYTEFICFFFWYGDNTSALEGTSFLFYFFLNWTKLNQSFLTHSCL